MTGKELREARVAAGLSLRQVADAVGITHVRLGEIEREKVAPWLAEVGAIVRAIEKGAK